MLLFYSYTRRWWKLLSLTKKPFKNNCLALWSDLFENFPLIIVASLTITNTLNISFCCYHNSIFSTLFGKGVLIIWLLEISLFSQYVGWLSIFKNFFSLPPWVLVCIAAWILYLCPISVPIFLFLPDDASALYMAERTEGTPERHIKSLIPGVSW